MLFNHITTWQKENINFEDEYSAIWTESHYWLNKQNDTTQIKLSSDQVFQAIQKILDAFGQKFDLSSLSDEIQKSKYYSELLKEYIFEDIRINEYPDKPSRKNCMFLAPIEVSVSEYGQRLTYDLSNKTLVELEVLEGSKVHFADLTLLNCNASSHLQKIEAARNYWKGTAERTFNTEVLFIGKFKIKRIL